MSEASVIAKRFHELYEYFAPSFGYQTREESAVPWDQVPESNRLLMVAVVHELIFERYIIPNRPIAVTPRPKAKGWGT